jgi:Ca2+:H+ antiporter
MSLRFLLIFAPIALGLDWGGAHPIAVFLASALAIVPLAGLVGEATENFAGYLGQTWGDC